MIDPFASFIGIKVYHLLAGLAGGVVRSIIRPGESLMQGIGTCIVGALTAAYCTPVAVPFVVQWFGPEAGTGLEGATGFAIGLSGMAVAEGILKAVASFRAGRP